MCKLTQSSSNADRTVRRIPERGCDSIERVVELLARDRRRAAIIAEPA